MSCSIKNLIYYTFLLFISIIFGLIFYTVSSPIIDGYANDSSIFIMMGRLFLDGKIPFVDFFDHKGPIIILIEALGQLIAPYRNGLFVLEVLNLFITLLIINRLSSLVLERKMTIALLFFFLFLFAVTAIPGNFTEEYSLIPLFISLYITLRYHFGSKKLKKTDVFLIGLSFSFLFWLRVNNAGAICGMCLYIFIDSFIRKDFKNLKVLFIYFLIANLPLTIIFISYFQYHDALYDLFYATFIFNFEYLHLVWSLNKYLIVTIIISLVVITGGIMESKKGLHKNTWLLSLSILICSIISSNLGYLFNHYLTLLMPAFILGLLFILKNIPVNFKRYALYCSILLFCCLATLKFVMNLKKDTQNENEYTVYKDSANKILSIIPIDEKTKIYYYLVNSNFYPMLKISPNHKYFVLQEWHGSHDIKIYDEINEMMRNNAPIWVLMEKKEVEQSDNNENRNKDFRDIISEFYTLYEENDCFILYHKK